MINNKLRNASPSLVDSGRQSLLDTFGKLPADDYLEWVETFGGSSTSEIVAMPDPSGNAVLETFHTAQRVAEIYTARSGFARNVPRTFAEVGYGPGGGVCICMTEPGFGTVWFADYDLADELLGADDSTFDDDSELPQIMSEIAENWTVFLVAH